MIARARREAKIGESAGAAPCGARGGPRAAQTRLPSHAAALHPPGSPLGASAAPPSRPPLPRPCVSEFRSSPRAGHGEGHSRAAWARARAPMRAPDSASEELQTESGFVLPVRGRANPAPIASICAAIRICCRAQMRAAGGPARQSGPCLSRSGPSVAPSPRACASRALRGLVWASLSREAPLTRLAAPIEREKQEGGSSTANQCAGSVPSGCRFGRAASASFPRLAGLCEPVRASLCNVTPRDCQASCSWL